MKMILKHTLIMCTLLSLSLPSNFLIGMEEEADSLVAQENVDEEKSIRSLFSLQNITKAAIGTVLISAFGFGIGYAISSSCPSSTLNEYPSSTPPPPYTPPPAGNCTTVFQLNEQYNCSDAEGLDPRRGAGLAAAVVRGCVPDCRTQPNSKFSSFVNPKRMFCENDNPNATAILQYLQESGTFYTRRISTSMSKSFDRVTYEENDTFHLSYDPVSVKEIEENPEAMQTLRNYLDFSNVFNPPCESFVIKDYRSSKQTQEYPLYPQQSKRNEKKYWKRSNQTTQKRNKQLFQPRNSRR